MATNIATATTVQDLLVELGNIPAHRLRLFPSPGNATVEDLNRINTQERSGIVELVDGTLVEKAIGYEASVVAAAILRIIGAYVSAQRLGLVSGADGMFQLHSSVRGPDVAFVSRERLPKQQFPSDAYPAIAPNLAVEVLSPGNTKGEMDRKRLEYSHSGVQILWIVDCTNRSVAVYTSPSKFRIYGEDETIDGGDAIPGLKAIVADFFRDLDIGLEHP